MERLQDKRVWLGGGALGAVLIAHRLVHVHRAGARVGERLHAQAAATLEQNDILQRKLKSLQVKSTQLGKYTSALNGAVVAALRQRPAAFTRQLTAQARPAACTSSASPSVPSARLSPLRRWRRTPHRQAPLRPPHLRRPKRPPPARLRRRAVLDSGDRPLRRHPRPPARVPQAIRTAGPRRALVTSTQVAPVQKRPRRRSTASTFTTQLTVFSAPQTPARSRSSKRCSAARSGTDEFR